MSPDLEPTLPVRLRHITIGAGGTLVASVSMVADAEGLNGREGFQSGSVERRVSDEGDGTLSFPNANGVDGRRHLDRFAIVADGDDYRFGDEWIEVWEGDVGAGELLGVLTPTGAPRDRREISLSLSDALVLLRQTRGTSAEVWAHAPRDVITHYSRVKQYLLAEEFNGTEVWASSASEATSPAGWKYRYATKTADGGVITLAPPANENAYASLPLAALGFSTDPYKTARVEFVIDTPALGQLDTLTFGFGGLTASSRAQISVARDWVASGASTPKVNTPGRHRVAIEIRERWAWCYFDGRLIGVIPRQAALTDHVRAYYFRQNPSSVAGQLVIHSLKVWHLVPYLLQTGADRGPMRLAGDQAPDGLDGRWFNDIDRPLERTLEPTALSEGVPRRIEPQINFPWSNPASWRHPDMPAASPWSAMWTGAIYLTDPANTTLRVTFAGRCRIWIGRTRWGEQIFDQWETATGGSTLDVAVGALDGEPGWYPIRIEYQTPGAGGSALIVQTKTGTGAFVAIGDTANGGAPLAPLGCFVGNLRRSSHFEAISDIARDFAVQYTVQPRSLESGAFPGHLAMGHRIGTITDHIITDDDATNVRVDSKAEGTVDILTADAAGLADPNSAAQLVAELVNFAGVQPGVHLAAQEEHEQMSALATESAMLQRLDAMLTIRSSVWEQLEARPGRRRPFASEMEDGIVLAGTLAERRWEPGDAARLDLPSVAVQDIDPRQAMAVARSFTPDGVGLPTLRWRQRPRGVRESLRDMQRQALDPQRNYQGQLTTIPGSTGGAYGGVDAYTRAAWARDIGALVKAEIVVMAKDDASAMTIEVNGTSTGKQVTAGGRYDVTPWVAATTTTVAFARMTGGTGNYSIQLILTVRI